MWPEYHGKRGAAEIGTCMFRYLQTLGPEIHDAVLVSDSCGGQNRNSMILAIAYYAVHHQDSLNTVRLMYLESGHTQMEVDSMHSCIERAARHKEIFTYREWSLVVAGARGEKPYTVVGLEYSDILDLQSLAAATVGTAAIRWQHVRLLEVRKDLSGAVMAGYSYDPSEMEEVVLRPRRSGLRQGPNEELEKKYTGVLPISNAKKADLMKLLQDGAIKVEYRGFYEAIPDVATIEDADDALDEEAENEGSDDDA